MVIDTGFTEFLALPSEYFEGLNLPIVGLQRMAMADGSISTLPVYEALAQWHGMPLATHAVRIEGTALLGMPLLQESRLRVDVAPGGPVQISPLNQ